MQQIKEEMYKMKQEMRKIKEEMCKMRDDIMTTVLKTEGKKMFKNTYLVNLSIYIFLKR